MPLVKVKVFGSLHGHYENSHPNIQSDNNAIMAFQEDLQLPQGQGLRKRVEMNVSKGNGRVEDQSLDLDARTLALLGKRQQLKV